MKLRNVSAIKKYPLIMAQSVFKTFILSLLVIAQVHFAFAQTASILPPAETTFFDSNGNPLTAGTVDFYIPSTTNRKTTWQDTAETIPNLNPVKLDSAGRALILGSGSYRQVVKDALGNLIWDQVTSSAGTGTGGSTATGDGDLVGTIKPWAGMTAPNQYAFTYGQEVSRTTFSALFTAITSAQAVFCTSGNPILNGLGDTTNFWIGMTIEASCIAGGNSTITAKTATTVTVALAPNTTTNITATFFPWGRGNGTTTFNIPDYRGLIPVGNNNMGGTASANLTIPFFGVTSPNSTGAAGGLQSHIILPTESAILTDTFTTTFSVLPSQYGPTTILTNVASTSGISVWASPTSTTTTQLIASGGTLNTIRATTNAGGLAHSIVPASKTINYIIKTTPDANSATANGVTDISGMTGSIGCGTGLLCTGNVISATQSGVTSLGGMSGVLTCGSGLTCAANAVGLATNTAVANQYVSGITAGVLTRGVFPVAGLPVVNLTDTAVCDGVTNDTTAINAWFTSIVGKIGYVAPGLTCRYTGILVMKSSATSSTGVWGYGATFKQLDSDAGSANSGITVGPNSSQTGNSDNAWIYGLTVDGNRANNTNTGGSAALIYVIGGNNFIAKDVSVINGRGDGIYAGGDTASGGARHSSRVIWDNVFSSNNYRTGGSIVGVDYMEIRGGLFQNTTNSNANGTQCGIDFEPNNTTSTNSDITMIGTKLLANNGGNLVGSGGICANIAAANVTTVRTIIQGVQVDSNNQYGAIFNVGGGSVNDIKIIGISGAANSVGLLSGTAYDSAMLNLPTTKTSSYAIANSETSIIFNCAATCTITLPAASSFPSRIISLKSIAAFTTVSASSNVVPITGGAAGTAILAATAGKYANLQSDGTNWLIMNAN